MSTRIRNALIGVVALALLAGAVWATGMNLIKGGLFQTTTPAYALFSNCGQGLRTGGDVKLRGVLVGEIGTIERVQGSDCKVELDLFPSEIEHIPANSGAQIRAKTVFGEKWVEILYPEDPVEERLAQGDTIPLERTIDPLEVETILNTALPILDAIDPEALAGTLEALADGFVGHEEAAIRAMQTGIEAMSPFNDNPRLAREGIRQLRESGELLRDVSPELLAAMDNLDELNRFTVANAQLIDESLERTPVLLNELSLLFETRFADFVKIADRGATVVGVLAARSGDLDRLLDALPKFNSNWIRNLNHVCRYRQATDEPGKSVGDRVPGRCWRVHNILSQSQGPYGPDEQQRTRRIATDEDYRDAGLRDVTDVGKLLYAPIVYTRGDLR